jgi:hypothetical protein
MLYLTIYCTYSKQKNQHMHRNINVLAHQFTPTCSSASRRHLQGVQCEPAVLLPKVMKAKSE